MSNIMRVDAAPLPAPVGRDDEIAIPSGIPRKRNPGRGRTILTQEQLDQARAMLREKLQYHQIARKLGIHKETLRRALDPKWRAMRNEQIARQAIRSKFAPTSPPLTIVRRMSEPIPAPVLADRDRRINLPLTTTAALCGDPPPGYSALDRKRGGP